MSWSVPGMSSWGSGLASRSKRLERLGASRTGKYSAGGWTPATKVCCCFPRFAVFRAKKNLAEGDESFQAAAMDRKALNQAKNAGPLLRK